ncbi:MAG: amino acid carrier protein [Flavobacteriaceae bacterium]|nr:amino acid carrier protein [Flavobacteriaceae bacterium]
MVFYLKFQTFLDKVIGPLEWVMLFLVIGGGIYLTLHSRGYPILKIKNSFKLLFSSDHNELGISRFQALSAVLAATVGLGNISGVAIAIYMGGPGVLVWMWLTAIIGSVIKFYSCSLAVNVRTYDSKENPIGGPMYYMSYGIKKWGKPMAIWFSIAGLFGVLPAFTANQLTEAFVSVVNPSKELLNIGDFNWKLIFGFFLALITSFVIFGGLNSIVKVSSSLVPLMVMIYLAIGITILIINFNKIIPTFSLIFNEAFNVNAIASGSFWGLIILGVRRAVFSNESGVGNAPMYHGQSHTKMGTDEGLVAMLGPFFDTIIVCTITGLIVLISGVYIQNDLNGISLTLEAFRKLFFGFGDILLMIMVFVFGISTLFTYSYYGVKCLGFLTKRSWGKYYNYVYILSIIISSLMTVDVVVGIIDISFALMCIPNMIAILILSPNVKNEMQERGWL